MQENKTITWFDNTYGEEPHSATIEQLLSAIYFGGRDGWIAREIEKIRTEPDKARRNALKQQNLPMIMWQGIFHKRSNEGLCQLSSVLCLDFDHCENLEQFKIQLQNIDWVLAYFLSPSGDGLKVLVPTDNTNIDFYDNCYRQLERFFKERFGYEADDNCRKLSQGCYTSFDPNLYYNPSAVQYNFAYDPSVKSNEAYQSGNTKSTISGFIPNWTEPDKKFLSETDRLTVMLSGMDDKNIIEEYDTKHQRYIVNHADGHKYDSIFKQASDLCKAGVHRDLAMAYLKKAFSDYHDPVKLELEVSNAYEINREHYCSERVLYGNLKNNYGRYY